jgi:Domain of unknown function (DUF4387)
MTADVPFRTLQSALASIRSKNAGPFTVTFDLFFTDRETFLDVVGQKVLTNEVVGALYGLEPAQVRIFEFEPALAIKVSVPRLVPGGSPGDSDVAGGQQFVPLLDIPLR